MKKPIIILLLCISCICSFGQVIKTYKQGGFTVTEATYEPHTIYAKAWYYCGSITDSVPKKHTKSKVQSTNYPDTQVKLHNENEGLLYQDKPPVVTIITDSCSISNEPIIWMLSDKVILKEGFYTSKIDTFTVYGHFIMMNDSAVKVDYYDASPQSFSILFSKITNEWQAIIPQDNNKQIDENKYYPIISYIDKK